MSSFCGLCLAKPIMPHPCSVLYTIYRGAYMYWLVLAWPGLALRKSCTHQISQTLFQTFFFLRLSSLAALVLMLRHITLVLLLCIIYYYVDLAGPTLMMTMRLRVFVFYSRAHRVSRLHLRLRATLFSPILYIHVLFVYI